MFSIQNKQILSIEILIFLVISVCPLSSLAPSTWKIGDIVSGIGEQRDKDDEQFKELLTVNLKNDNLHIDLESSSQGVVLPVLETTLYSEIKTKLKEEWGRVVDFSVYVDLKNCIMNLDSRWLRNFFKQFIYFRMPNQTWFRTKIYQNRIFRPLAPIIFPISIIQSIICYLFRIISSILILVYYLLVGLLSSPFFFILSLFGHEYSTLELRDSGAGDDSENPYLGSIIPGFVLLLVFLPLLALLCLMIGTIVLLLSFIIALFVTIYSFFYIIIYWFISLFRSITTTKKNSSSQRQVKILDRLIANHDFKNSKSIKAFLRSHFYKRKEQITIDRRDPLSSKSNVASQDVEYKKIPSYVEAIDNLSHKIDSFVSQKMLLNSDINSDFLIDQFVDFFQYLLKTPEGKSQTAILISLLEKLAGDIKLKRDSDIRKKHSKKILKKLNRSAQDILRLNVLHNLLLSLYNKQLYQEKHKGSNMDILLIKNVELKKKMDSFPWIDALKKAA